MTQDDLNRLGALVLDHRFKRLMNRLLAEADCIYRAQKVEFKPRWVSTSLLLWREGPLPVTEIASRLRITHPAVIQITGGMEKAGLTQAQADPQDGRRRLLRITEKGRRLMPIMERIWDVMSQVQEEVFREAGCEIMQVIDAVEALLDEESLCRRVVKRLGSEKPEPQAAPVTKL